MQESELTNGELQEFMRSTMNDTMGLRLDDLNNTMARIWSKVYKRLEKRLTHGAGESPGLWENQPEKARFVNLGKSSITFRTWRLGILWNRRLHIYISL